MEREVAMAMGESVAVKEIRQYLRHPLHSLHDSALSPTIWTPGECRSRWHERLRKPGRCVRWEGSGSTASEERENKGVNNA